MIMMRQCRIPKMMTNDDLIAFSFSISHKSSFDDRNMYIQVRKYLSMTNSPKISDISTDTHKEREREKKKEGMCKCLYLPFRYCIVHD